jgi:hypothetical protein
VPQIVVGDQIRLRQILLNLAGNAVKFTSHGEIVLEAKVEQRQGDRCTLLFSVRDTGIGIPKEKQDLLFQSYAQMDASTARTHGGTGLGLSISKKLAEMMGGRMWVESDVGQGSTFFFTIETQAIDLEKGARLCSPRSGRQAPARRRKQCHQPGAPPPLHLRLGDAADAGRRGGRSALAPARRRMPSISCCSPRICPTPTVSPARR